MMLIAGSDNECAVVKIIERCVQKNMRNCKCNERSKIVGLMINKALKSFECKIDETAVDLGQQNVAIPLLSNDLLLQNNFKTVSKQCNFDKFVNPLQNVTLIPEFTKYLLEVMY